MSRNAATRKRAAGERAESQMAFYLNRAFRDATDLRVINDLRLKDPNQPEHDDRPGVCQIDHLVLHRHGAFIIESKSVGDEITVTPDGHGGDEWTYRFNGTRKGVPSPIKQAERQRDLLRTLLQSHRESLLGKMAVGLRTISKVVGGTDQRGFSHMPIQLIVAVSDNGKIKRMNRWKEPMQPFKTFLCKADQVTDRIREELKTHSSWLRNVARQDAAKVRDYGLWSMKPAELDAVTNFLRAHNTSPPAPAVPPQTTPLPGQDLPAPQPVVPAMQRPSTSSNAAKCKSCQSTHLAARSGRYGYYWYCNDCGTNTAMPKLCSVCGADGRRGGKVSIRKQGAKYFRSCQVCGIDQCIWKQPGAG